MNIEDIIVAKVVVDDLEKMSSPPST